MAISINWGTRVITIPQADLTLVSGSLYELDVDAFRLALKDLEDSADGAAFPDTHRHNTEVTLGGVTFARTLEIINGYTVTFEDVGSPYRVRCVGANHNISDVQNLNDVSLIIGNSAGLQTVVSGSGVTQQDKLDIADEVRNELSVELAEILNAKFILQRKRTLDPSTGVFTIYDADGVTPLFTAQTYKDVAGTQPYNGEGRIHRTEELS